MQESVLVSLLRAWAPFCHCSRLRQLQGQVGAGVCKCRLCSTSVLQDGEVVTSWGGRASRVLCVCLIPLAVSRCVCIVGTCDALCLDQVNDNLSPIIATQFVFLKVHVVPIG